MRGISAAQGLRVLDLRDNSIVCIEGIVFVECNEWFSSNRRPSYVHRILGSAGGKHCKSLKRIVQLKVFSPLKAILYLTQGVFIDGIYRINHTETYNLSAATLVTFASHKIMTKMCYSFSDCWKIIHLFGGIKNWLWSNLNSSPKKLKLFTKSENYFPPMSSWWTDWNIEL